MPGKSRRKRGRQPPARKALSPRQVLDARQTVAPGGSVEAGAPLAAVPAVGVSSKAVPAQQPVRYPYIGAELRMTGILAVLMLVVLVVLKLVIG